MVPSWSPHGVAVSPRGTQRIPLRATCSLARGKHIRTHRPGNRPARTMAPAGTSLGPMASPRSPMASPWRLRGAPAALRTAPGGRRVCKRHQKPLATDQAARIVARMATRIPLGAAGTSPDSMQTSLGAMGTPWGHHGTPWRRHGAPRSPHGIPWDPCCRSVRWKPLQMRFPEDPADASWGPWGRRGDFHPSCRPGLPR